MTRSTLTSTAQRAPSAHLEQSPLRLAESLTFKEKVERSLELICRAHAEYGEGLLVSHSGGKDSSVVWHLAKRVSPEIRGFAVTTKYKPRATREFLQAVLARYPEIRLYQSQASVERELHDTAPQECCRILKVQPLERALRELGAACWATGLRCTEGPTRADLRELEVRADGLVKLNPILLWLEREVWQYLALESVPVNPLYQEGYRSLGCAPCTTITRGPYERAGRWTGKAKCGGECGLHLPGQAAKEGESR